MTSEQGAIVIDCQPGFSAANGKYWRVYLPVLPECNEGYVTIPYNQARSAARAERLAKEEVHSW